MARSLFLYRGPGARLVHVLKYEQGTWLEVEIAHLLSRSPAGPGDIRWRDYFDGALLVPIPLHRRRERSRGYNQAVVIARGIHRAFPGTRMTDCLLRTRRTPTQTFLSREERQLNMAGAFTCKREVPPGGPLILVDDVLTTGATLSAAAMALLASGSGPVRAFTLAHG